MANTFDAILAQQLSRYFQDDLISRSTALVLRELTSGPPTAAWVATELALSQRSFQRRLSELGLTYQELLDQTRHDLARRYLDDPSKSVTEITFLLGFSEQSAFTRAFKRWSGIAPTAYRGA
jgi:AraC-like DNA-binding protein